jgi:D-alanyl-D-alanine carboxypeptidase/D-alanyl-D-alanine-endopeptidase (penicillin-binding protein 4)
MSTSAGSYRATSRRRRLIAGGLVVFGVVALVVSLRAPSTPGAPEPGARLATPLWSARRVPQPILDHVALGRLQTELAARTASMDACYLVVGGEGTLAAASPDTGLIPASTHKLLTSAAALDVLGPEFRYETRVVAPAAPADGTVERLWLIGGGDPVIVTPEKAAALEADPETRGDASSSLAALADDIVRAGVRTVTGGITAVDSRYDTTRYLSQWPAAYRSDREIGPVGALTVNDGFGGPDGNGPETDPAINAADQLGRLLAERGVALGPPSRADDVPRDAAPVATLRSPPLDQVLTEFLSSSDNLTGEMLVREIAAHRDRTATTANGTEIVAERLRALGIPADGLVVVDGSGLARGNRVTCNQLVAVLNLSREPKFATLRTGLAIAGFRGTLAERLGDSALATHMWAKTGSLSNVTGLAGFVDVKEPLTFALLVNGRFGESAGTNLREQMAEAIGRYPDIGSADAVIPAPDAPASP